MRLKENDWAGHVWRKPEASVKTVLQEDPRGNDLWEDRDHAGRTVKRNVADFHADTD